MKVTYLKIKNIGLIADETIQFNKPLILLYGEIRQGKSTFLNCVRWVCGGAFPADIIRHGQDEAEIELGVEGGLVSRQFYRSKKTKEVVAREVTFIRDGRPVGRPVSELKRFLNPFLLDQNHLAKMGETERKAFFVELFGVDTKELDLEAFNNDKEASRLRAKLTGYGTINLTPVERVDVDALKAKLQGIRDDHKKACDAARKEHDKQRQEIDARNDVAKGRANNIARCNQKKTDLESKIRDLRALLLEAETELQNVDAWLAANPSIPLEVYPNFGFPADPDVSELEKQIQDGAAQNVRADQYEANKRRDDERQKDQSTLTGLENRAREIKAEKTKKLAKISDEAGIPGLKFEEDGSFSYQDTTAGMLSTAQLMRLSSELSKLYPEGFGLELIDRGESLGKSIFDFVDRAKSEDLTILATIVGEAPAKVPAEIGVFVVESGAAKPKA